MDEPIQLDSYPDIATEKIEDGSQVVNIGRSRDGRISDEELFVSDPIAVTDGASFGFPLHYASVRKIQRGDAGGPDMLDGTHTIVGVDSGARCDRQVLARVDLVAGWIEEQIAANGGHGGEPGTGGADPGAGGSDPGAGAGDPGAGGSDPGAGAGDPGAGGSDPGAGAGDPGAGGSDPGAGAGDPGAGGSDPGAGGSDPGAGGSDPGAGAGDPGTAVSFSEVVQPILTAACAACHSGPTAFFGLDLSFGNARGELMSSRAVGCGNKPLVTPGSSAESYIVAKVASTPEMCGAKMPLGQPALDDAEIQAISDWIDAGAPDN